MQTCMVLAGTTPTRPTRYARSSARRRSNWSGAAGQEFVEGCVDQRHGPAGREDLWEQMAEFAKYSFGRAHAYGYAVLAYWTAWLKVHYPVEFFTSVLSTVKAERIPEFVSEARRMGFSILPPDINESGENLHRQGLNVRYGLEAIKGIYTAPGRWTWARPSSSTRRPSGPWSTNSSESSSRRLRSTT
jgi:DNA polymerase-3 subunit alpha